MSRVQWNIMARQGRTNRVTMWMRSSPWEASVVRYSDGSVGRGLGCCTPRQRHARLMDEARLARQAGDTYGAAACVRKAGREYRHTGVLP